MRRVCTWMVALAMAVAFFVLPMNAEAEALQVVQGNSADGMIRVWLSSIKSNTTYDITVDGSYSVGGTALSSGSTVKVEFSGGVVYVTANGTRTPMGASVTLTRQSGGVRIAQSLAPGNSYPGELRFFYTGGTAYVVCALHVEDYVYGVLPFEMDNGFPLEALKAQAVAARTYAVFSKKSGGSYDVTDTITHQVFRGVDASKTRCIQAADETKGLVMLYDGSYIEASFSASNGGQTETRTNAWGSSRVAYQTIKDDPYDAANANSVTKSYLIYRTPQLGSSPQATTLIQNALAQKLGGLSTEYTVAEVLNVAVHTPKFSEPSRVYTQLRISVRLGSGQTVDVDIPIFTTVKLGLSMGINSANNELFSVMTETNGFRVISRRFGHGIGLSQRGAQQMANSGMGFQEILGFYYENVRLERRSFTSNWTAASSSGTSSGGSTTQGTGTTTTQTGQQTSTIAGEYAAKVALSSESSKLNFRQTASIFGKVIGSIPHGTAVTILGDADTWYKIRYGTQTGYAAKEYIQSDQLPSGASGATAVVTLQSGMLNLRGEASRSASILLSIPNGAIVDVAEKGGEWSRVTYSGKTGYVMTQYLSVDMDVQTPSTGQTSGVDTATVSLSNTNELLNLRMTGSMQAPILMQMRHGTAMTVLEKGTDWSKVSVSGTAGYVMNTYVAFGSGTAVVQATATPIPNTNTAVSNEIKAIVSIESGMLNLRNEPNTNAAVLTGLASGTEVTVTSAGETWSAVTTKGGVSGHVMTKYLIINRGGTRQATATAPPVQAQSGAATIYTSYGGGVNIRSAPSMNGSVLGSVPTGATVTVHERGDQWTRATYSGVTGYIATAYVKSAATSSAVQDYAAAQPTAVQPVTTAAPMAAAQDKVWVKTAYGGSVNIRSEPSTYGSVLGSAPNGAELSVLARNDGWTYIQYGAVVGHVANELLSTTAVNSQGSAVTGITAYDVSQGAVGAQPISSDYSNAAWEQAQTLTAWVVTDYGGGVNLRTGPSVESKVIESVPAGTEVTVLEADSEWTYVQYGDMIGYIATTYISYDL